MTREALYWESLRKDLVKCFLCPHKCLISLGNLGICGVRKNEKGKLYTLNYGLCTAVAMDPITKKPFRDFFPQSMVLSLGTFGCNLQCPFCQNWTIAHSLPKGNEITPRDIAKVAKGKEKEGNIGVAYTYSEPLVWYEFVLDAAKEVKKLGLKNLLVTNGYINEEPLRNLLPYIDAVNLDVKAFNGDFYQKLCKGDLLTVKRTAEILAESCHLEITTLVIPGENDSIAEIKELAYWISNISDNIPLHLTRYFPHYKFSIPPTPGEKLRQLQGVASNYLKKVYLGNI